MRNLYDYLLEENNYMDQIIKALSSYIRGEINIYRIYDADLLNSCCERFHYKIVIKNKNIVWNYDFHIDDLTDINLDEIIDKYRIYIGHLFFKE